MKNRFDFKLIFRMIITLIMVVMLGVNSVFAETVPNKLTMKYRDYKPPISFPQKFHIKETTDGKYVYCMTYAKSMPITSVNYTNTHEYTNPGTNYILEQGYKAKSDEEYFVAQTALWIYLMDKNLMEESNSIKTFKTSINNSSDKYAKQINDMVSKAKSLKSYGDNEETKISFSDGDVKFTKNGDNYVSSEITVTGSDDYNIELVNAPEGTTYDDNNGKITVIVPASSVSDTKATFSIKVTTSKTTFHSYKYTPSDSKYQVMAATYSVTKNASDTKEMSLATKKVVISKQDIANKQELPGATLQILDKDGKVVKTWTSTDTPYIITDLEPGEYTLVETQAPDGYVLSEEKIQFTVTEDGDATTNVVMYNKAIEQPKEEIAVPATGTNKTIISSMIGVIIIGVGSVLITKNMKKKNGL